MIVNPYDNTTIIVDDSINVFKMFNSAPKSYDLDVASLFIQQTQRCDELMHTVVHRKFELTLAGHYIDHSLSSC